MISTGKGLKGNSGVFPGGHISMNYSNNGMVFIESKINVEGNLLDSWDRIPIENLTPEHKIIKCYRCEKPAITLDHYYPFMNDRTFCEDHEKTT